MAEAKRRRHYAQNRTDIEKLYFGFLKLGFFPPFESEADFWEAQLAEYQVEQRPLQGWSVLAREIRLVNLGLSDPVRRDAPGKAEKAKKARKMARRLEALAQELIEWSWDTQLGGAVLHAQGKFKLDPLPLKELAKTFDIGAEVMESEPQSPRWRESAQRNLRIELAVLLSPVFENLFGLKAVPCGGSHARELSDTNDWTRFFQAVASAFWQETVTPDRQAVLWEATQIELIEQPPNQYWQSDIDQARRARLSDSATT